LKKAAGDSAAEDIRDVAEGLSASRIGWRRQTKISGIFLVLRVATIGHAFG